MSLHRNTKMDDDFAKKRNSMDDDIAIGAMGGAPRHVPPLEEFWGGTAPPKKSSKIFKIFQKMRRKGKNL